MDTKLVVPGRIAIEPGHRIEVSEAVVAADEGVSAADDIAGAAVAAGSDSPAAAEDHVGGAAVGGWMSSPSGVIALVDLDSGVRYQVAEISRIPVRRWSAHVIDCLVLLDGPNERTVLTVAPIEGDRTGAGDALRDASAAVDAAKAEAARWGGSARPSSSAPARIW